MLTSSTIKRYEKYSVAELKKKCQVVFNSWIRFRDKDKGCISCPSMEVSHCSHYLSQGHHSLLRYDEFNSNGSCVRCNLFLHGNLIGYRKGLIKRYGEVKVLELEGMPKSAYKWDRFTLIDKIEDYKTRLKESKN